MKLLLKSLFLVTILSSSVIFSGCIGGDDEPQIPDDFYGDDIYPAIDVESFVLVDEIGNNYSSQNLDGQVVIVIFMFTRCPDVCPIVSANANWLYGQLNEAEQEKVSVISITVDPWNDNSTILAQYMDDMSLNWSHLTGEVEQLEPIWGNFDVGLKTVTNDDYYQNNSDNTTGSDETSGRHHPDYDYLVDHSTGTILVDKKGSQRVWWGDVDWVPDLVLEDVKKLLLE